MTTGNLLFGIILCTVMYISVNKNKLTPSGAIAGGFIGTCIFLGAGFTGIAMVGSFFLLGTLATSFKINIKEKFGAAEINKGRRTALQVIANGIVAAIAGVLSRIFPDIQAVFQLMMAAALASATADTLSSELGTVYGKQFYDIPGFSQGRRGENGVVSMEGTLIGIAGSIIIAIVYAIGFGWNIDFLWIVVSGTIGNFADSLLGATLERRLYLKNNTVNLVNTLVAALSALAMQQFYT